MPKRTVSVWLAGLLKYYHSCVHDAYLRLLHKGTIPWNSQFCEIYIVIVVGLLGAHALHFRFPPNCFWALLGLFQWLPTGSTLYSVLLCLHIGSALNIVKFCNKCYLILFKLIVSINTTLCTSFEIAFRCLALFSSLNNTLIPYIR